MSTIRDFLDITPPPALTWTHLFPASSTYDTDGVPESIAARLPTGTGPYPVRVFWKNASAAIAGAAAYSGIVGVNCREFPVATLKAAGFRYLRHLAIVPNLSNPRWFVPLDSPTVSAAGLSLYTPSRASARLKRAAARIAMHFRLPIWFKDHLWIAQRDVPPLEMALNPLLAELMRSSDGASNLSLDPKIRWALSGGAPEGARNRKASALAIAPDGQMLAFVKLARSDIARRIADNETAILNHLAHTSVTHGTVPRIIFSGDVDATRVLAQSPLPGRPAPVPFAIEHERFLRSLQSETKIRADRTSTVSDLVERLKKLVPARPALLELLYRVQPVFREFTVPSTVIHGDFAPWNLRIHEGRIGAFDWEYGQADGLPLIDEIHYRLQSGWLLDDWTSEQACNCLKALAESRPLGLSAKHTDAISAIYLFDALARLFGEGYGDEQDVITWHQKVLENLSRRWRVTTEVSAA